MSKKNLHNIKIFLSNSFGHLSILAFLLFFLNFSVVFQYIDLNELGLSKIELSEEEEGEEEEAKEEADETKYEAQHTFFGFNAHELKNNNIGRNASILMNTHIDVFTPPPELS